MKKRLFQGVLLVAVVSVTVYVWGLLSRETLESAATKSFRALQDGDGHTFLRLMPEVEREAYGMNADQWETFLKQYIQPELQTWRLVKGEKEEFVELAGMYSKIYTFARSDGRTVPLMVEAADTPDGPKAVGLVHNIISSVAVMKRDQPGIEPVKLQNFYLLRESYESDAQNLRALGLHGVFLVDRQRIVAWDELAKTMTSLIEHYESYLESLESGGDKTVPKSP